jgi:hypothetical protein
VAISAHLRTDCQELKSDSECYVDRNSKLGLSYYCKACTSRRAAERYRRGKLGLSGARASSWAPPGFKRCPSCTETKAVQDFPRSRSSRDGLAAYCKPCHNARTKATYARLYGNSRHYHLMRRYGISAAEVEELIAEQGGVCAICLTGKPEHVDHDHRTGRVRGILCFNCNGGLGQMRDRVDVLLAAVDYLGEKPWRKSLVARGVYRLSS